MKHYRCRTVNSSTDVMLASQSPDNANFTLAPFVSSQAWAWGHPSILMNPFLAPNDFQSNAATENICRPSGSVVPLTGLGIRYVEPTPVSPSMLFPTKFFQRTGVSTANNCQPAESHPTDLVDVPPPFVPTADLSKFANQQDPSTLTVSADPYDSASGLQLPWSFSSIPSAIEGLDLDLLTFQYPPVGGEPSWPTSSFSNSSSVVGDITAELTAAIGGSRSPSLSDLQISRSFSSIVEAATRSEDALTVTPAKLRTPTFRMPAIATPDMVVPVADINMYNMGLLSQDSSNGVNPADIMGSFAIKTEDFDFLQDPPNSVLGFDLPPSPRPNFAPSDAQDDLPGVDVSHISSIDAMKAIVSFLNTAVPQKECHEPVTVDNILDDIHIGPQHHIANAENGAYYHVLQFSPSNHPTHTSEYQPTPKLPGVPSLGSSPFPSPRQRKSRCSAKKASRKTAVKKAKNARTGKGTGPSVSISGTPILDAHHGVELKELQIRAAKYRIRHPGVEIDKKWLLSFAGKLSEKGQLLDEFRCYVVGCNQTNRRRDHILIHVGSHVDQRPFSCAHCPSRFLRRNECKRHELSHTGIRPFVCDLCPREAASFVRQDLLKRHLKRTHAIDTKANKENLDKQPPLKRVKLQ